MELSLSGASGVASVGYARAATLLHWRLETIGPSLYRVIATIDDIVPVYLSMRPLRLALASGAVCYTWEVESVECEGARIEAWVQGDPSLSRA